MLETVVIAGASLAGLRTAESLRHEGFDGTVVLVGDEDELPYDRPPLSKQFLRGEWDEARVRLRSASELEELNLELELGTAAEGIDRHANKLVLADGRRIGYDALVIATGARPSRPLGWDLAGLFDLRSLDQARHLAEALRAAGRVAIVGAGFIGCEVAASARHLGVEVTLIEALQTPLEKALGGRLGAYCAGIHRQHGIDLRPGVTVAELIGASGSVRALRLSDGTTVESECVVVGLGVRPNAEWLAGSGLLVDDGVVCNEACEAAEGIYAVGDVARIPHGGSLLRFEHWTNASEQASFVARRLVGAGGTAPFCSVPYFWSDQHGLRLQSAGLPGPDDEVEMLAGSFEAGRFLLGYRRGSDLRGVVAGNWPRLLGAFRRLLAGAPSWDEASELASSLLAGPG